MIKMAAESFQRNLKPQHQSSHTYTWNWDYFKKDCKAKHSLYFKAGLAEYIFSPGSINLIFFQ